MLRSVRVALVQLTSTDDVAANLAAVRRSVAEAAGRGAELVALPENFAYLRREGLPVPCAQGLDGEIVGSARELARQHGVWLLAGSFPEAIAGDARVYNTSVLIGPDGGVEAVYRKIHLFDVDLGDGTSFRESATVAPGELFRAMAARGASFLCVPAAFTPQTGKDHWEVLLRARAIENQAFVLAPAQCGRHSEKRASHGRSLVIDPWGLVLAQAGDRPAVVTADCDLEELERVRRRIPALRHRRL
jgi:predicted amidohydrolase